MAARPPFLAALELSAAGLLMLLRRWRRERTVRPRASHTVPGMDFAAISQARYRRGGDYYEVFASPHGTGVEVVVGDVAGHDAVAARLTLIAGRLLRARPAVPGRLAPLMGELNRELTRHMKGGRFMTLFLAVMVGEPRSIHWISAGHAPVIVYDPLADGFGEMPGHDIPLGIDPEWQYHELNHTGWATGALLVVGTDGIWEARNPVGDMYGKERLIGVVHANRASSAAEIVRAVTADVALFRSGTPPTDDATLVVVKAI